MSAIVNQQVPLQPTLPLIAVDYVDFRNQQIIPTEEDINGDPERFVRPNKQTGKYNDGEHYLDVQFRLYREDFIRPIRNGINKFRDIVPSTTEINIDHINYYQSVSISGVKIQQGDKVLICKFEPNRIDESRRLKTGTLVCLSSDNFKSFFFGSLNQPGDDSQVFKIQI